MAGNPKARAWYGESAAVYSSSVQLMDAVTELFERIADKNLLCGGSILQREMCSLNPRLKKRKR
jgi:hypothetical protein